MPSDSVPHRWVLDGVAVAGPASPVGVGPNDVAISDLDGDGVPDLAVANSNDDHVSVLLGAGDGTFGPAMEFNVSHLHESVVIDDLDGDGDADLVTGFFYGRSVAVLFNRTAENTVSASLACVPSSGTLPFATGMEIQLYNRSTRSARRVAGRIDVSLAGGQSYSNWKAGWMTLWPGESFISSWEQSIPGYSSLIGGNIFTVLAEDVTPPPYNQPPYPPSGDTDTSACMVVGLTP